MLALWIQNDASDNLTRHAGKLTWDAFSLHITLSPDPGASRWGDVLRSSEPIIRASALAALPAYLKARGIQILELLDEAGIPHEALTKPQLPIPFKSAALLFDIASRRLDDPAFGLSYALAFPPGGTGLLGQMVMSAPTIRDVFDVLSRYLQVHMSPVAVRFEEMDGIGKLIFAWPPTLSEPQTHITGFYFASLILRLRKATGEGWVPLSVDFQHRAPDDLRPYHALFGTRLNFERRENAIVVDATTLAKRMPRPLEVEGLHNSIIELTERHLLEQANAESAMHRLQAAIIERLAREQAFDLETVAADLALSTRSLQWRLEQEDTSYEKVLLAIRRKETERYLRDTTHQLTRIAELLGFSELSAFTRWSQRQFRMTPSALRQFLRKGGRATPSSGDDPA